ncbi:hypothetical protein ACS0TY_012456 [Phlomoides rotata]
MQVHRWSLHRKPSKGLAHQREGILCSLEGPKRVDTNNTGVQSFWFFNNTWESLLKGVEFDATHFITEVSGKYPRLWALKGAHPNTVNRWYKFGALASIRTVAPGFREISELPGWWGKGPSTKNSHRRIGAMRKSGSRHKEKKTRRLSSFGKNKPTTNGPAQFTEKKDKDDTQTFPIKGAQSSERRSSKIRESTHLSPSSSPLYYRVKIRAFVLVFLVYTFCPLFLYSTVREPKKYLRLKNMIDYMFWRLKLF